MLSACGTRRRARRTNGAGPDRPQLERGQKFLFIGNKLFVWLNVFGAEILVHATERFDARKASRSEHFLVAVLVAVGLANSGRRWREETSLELRIRLKRQVLTVSGS